MSESDYSNERGRLSTANLLKKAHDMETGKSGIPGVFSIGEVLGVPGGVGSRQKVPLARPPDDLEEDPKGVYRVRSPTRSERMNRAIAELGLSAFKIHALLWTWRGAPARGELPFFTIHSLSRFCHMSRPTVRVGLAELNRKGWITRREYNKHHKNALYGLVGIRKVPRPGVSPEKREEANTNS